MKTKKWKYKIIFAAFALIFSAFCFTNVFAGDNSISVFVDGEELYMDVPPIITQGRTMVPLRAISEAVGCTVEWYDADKRIVVYTPAGGDPLLVMHVNDRVVTVNHHNGETGVVTGGNVTIDAPPIIVNGRTLVPLRFIAETIGFEVEWNEASRTVYLRSAIYEEHADGMFPRGIVYNEDFYIQGDPGDGLTSEEGALELTYRALVNYYEDFLVEGPITITLVGLSDIDGEECYVYQVNDPYYNEFLFAVGYDSYNIYEYVNGNIRVW